MEDGQKDSKESTKVIPEKQEENIVTELSSQKEYSMPTNSDSAEETDQPMFNFVNLEENNIPFLLMSMTLKSWVPLLQIILFTKQTLSRDKLCIDV